MTIKRSFLTWFVSLLLASSAAMAEEAAKPTAPAAPPAQAPAGGTTNAATPAEGAKPSGTPKIELDRTTYDFGSTSLVQSVSGTFTISNTGDGLLELKKPTTSCG